MNAQKEKSAPGSNRVSAEKVISTCEDKASQRKKQALSFADINTRALSLLALILLRWLPGGKMRGCEYVVKNPRRADTHAGSFSINIRTGRWADFASGDTGGDVTSLAAYLFNLRQN